MDGFLASPVGVLAITVAQTLALLVPVLLAVAYLTWAERKVLAAMQLRKGPNVVGVFGLLQPFADALKMLTKGMCADWGARGIQINGIGPGYFGTEMTVPLQADPEFDAWVRRRTPAGRWGDPEDLVGAAVFLASRASDFVNGQILYVDGGLLAVL